MFQSKGLYKFSALILVILSGCQPKDTFSWNAGLSSPKYYSAAPFVEYFYQGISVAGASTNIGMGQGWGVTMGGYTGGDKFKPVPDSVYVRWACGIDEILYEGGYKLPREKMIGLFKKNAVDPFGDKVKYGLITAGMAPGGNVTIWLQGGLASTEICKFKVKNNGIWMKENKEYQEFKEKVENSREYLNSETNIFRYLHGVPYKIWETGEKEYNYDIGFRSEEKKYNYDMIFYTKDGSWIELNNTNSFVPWGTTTIVKNNFKTKIKQKYKLPVEFHLQWYSKDQSEWFSGNIILPQDLPNLFLKKKYDMLIVEIKNNTGKDIIFGDILLVNKSNKDKIMTFQLGKYDDKLKKSLAPYYSLPKDYVFPKWQGREPLTKPTDFEYWQEK